MNRESSVCRVRVRLVSGEEWLEECPFSPFALAEEARFSSDLRVRPANLSRLEEIVVVAVVVVFW